MSTNSFVISQERKSDAMPSLTNIFSENSIPVKPLSASSSVNTSYATSSLQTAGNAPRSSIKLRLNPNVIKAPTCRSKDSPLNTATEENSKKITELQATIDTLTQEKVGLEKDLKKEQDSKRVLKFDNELNFTKLTNATKKISELEQEIGVLREEVNYLQNQKTEQNSSTSNLRVENTGGLTLFSQGVDQTVAFTPQFFYQAMVSLQQTVNNTNTMGNRVFDEMAALRAELAEKNRLIEDFRNKEISLLACNVEKQETIVKLEGIISSNKEFIKHQSESSFSQKIIMTRQQECITKLQGTIDQQQGTINQQQGTIDQQQGTIDQQQGTVNRQQGTIRCQEEAASKQQAAIVQLQCRNTCLEGKLEDKKEKIQNLKQNNEKLLQDLQPLNSHEVVILYKEEPLLKRLGKVLDPEINAILKK